jgi:5,6,7,8-tetrahydromethanopterin hydro-lyase
MDDLDGRIGEAWAGDAPNGSHVNLVIARRGSPTAAAAVAALGNPRTGHAPFLACLGAGALARPATIVVNKTTIASDELARYTWGAAQLGIAQGVLDAVAEGVVDPGDAAELLLLVAVWIDPAAHDETAVRKASRTATFSALADALRLPSAEEVTALAARRETANTPFYEGD